MIIRGRRRLVLTLLAVLGAGAALVVLRLPPGAEENGRGSFGYKAPTASPAAGESLSAREHRIAGTVWAKEILAQECGRTIEALWDALNAASNKLELVGSFGVGEVVLPRWSPPQPVVHDLELHSPLGAGRTLGPEEWRGRIEEAARAGWELAQAEFRQIRFATDTAGRPGRSDFYFSAHLTNADGAQRAILEGELGVEWNFGPAEGRAATVKRVDASRIGLRTRRGEVPLQLWFAAELEPPRRRFPIDPLILHDLDGDGLAEILLPAVNLGYERDDGGRFTPRPLCPAPPDLLAAALVADFNLDGVADLLGAKSEGLVLHLGEPSAHGFTSAESVVWHAPVPVEDPMALTCGDVDGDGDLDVFLGQYRVPTLGAVLKPSYHDANDGFPAYLLVNDGRGAFTDATLAAGLAAHRHRRTYSASLVDLDADRDLDLMVASDFAGADVYQNDGHGRFREVTRAWLAEPHAFGMAQAAADFNADGRLDLLLIGMPSATVDRLEHLGLVRPGGVDDRARRRQMTFGNRLFLARPGSGFEQTSLNDTLARSGWSWGCGPADFDNDGFTDVYIANGLQTTQSVREYEPEFWLHDIFVEEATDDVEATLYFSQKYARTRGAGWSYGGYEKNRLYLNQRGASFLEVGHLFGVALPEDCRNVVVDDLDGDGRMDLVVTTFEVWPVERQTLRVYGNALRDTGNWIGFRFGAAGCTASVIGTQVVVHGPAGASVSAVVAGDAYRSQRAPTLHFGLGQGTRVDRAEIRWPNGPMTTVREPALNQYHALRPPAPGADGG